MTSDIRVERVAFDSAGDTLSGLLHLPTAQAASSPALVVVGAWRSLKEQMAAGYARELAARGFVALAFDYRGWGESEGSPRSVEDPFVKAADIVAAATFLAGRDDVDETAIGGLGICAGSAYLATAATQTELIKSVALIAPALPSRETALRTLGSMPAEAGLEPWLDYDAQAAAAVLAQPLFVMHSKAAASPESVDEFIAKVPRHVDQVWLDGVTQEEFYYAAGPVTTASDAVAEYFRLAL